MMYQLRKEQLNDNEREKHWGTPSSRLTVTEIGLTQTKMDALSFFNQFNLFPQIGPSFFIKNGLFPVSLSLYLSFLQCCKFL